MTDQDQNPTPGTAQDTGEHLALQASGVVPGSTEVFTADDGRWWLVEDLIPHDDTCDDLNCPANFGDYFGASDLLPAGLAEQFAAGTLVLAEEHQGEDLEDESSDWSVLELTDPVDGEERTVVLPRDGVVVARARTTSGG